MLHAAELAPPPGDPVSDPPSPCPPAARFSSYAHASGVVSCLAPLLSCCLKFSALLFPREPCLLTVCLKRGVFVALSFGSRDVPFRCPGTHCSPCWWCRAPQGSPPTISDASVSPIGLLRICPRHGVHGNPGVLGSPALVSKDRSLLWSASWGTAVLPPAQTPFPSSPHPHPHPHPHVLPPPGRRSSHLLWRPLLSPGSGPCRPQAGPSADRGALGPWHPQDLQS